MGRAGARRRWRSSAAPALNGVHGGMVALYCAVCVLITSMDMLPPYDQCDYGDDGR